MYEQLITKIGETLANVSNVKDYFTVPKTKIDRYPYVYYKPTGFQNSFDTTKDNFAIYRFSLYVGVGTAGSTAENAFNVVLPRTVDAIIAQFNADWNYGTIDGHRVWVKIDSAAAWELDQVQDGLEASALLNLEIKLLTTN